MRGWKNTLHADGEQNKSEEAVPVSDKIDFKTDFNQIKRRALHMIKESIQQEDITFVIIYDTNIGGPKFIKQK